MKRYLIIGGYQEIKTTDEISKQDLISIKDGLTGWLIDTYENTYFNKEENNWELIK